MCFATVKQALVPYARLVAACGPCGASCAFPSRPFTAALSRMRKVCQHLYRAAAVVYIARDLVGHSVCFSPLLMHRHTRETAASSLAFAWRFMPISQASAGSTQTISNTHSHLLAIVKKRRAKAKILRVRQKPMPKHHSMPHSQSERGTYASIIKPPPAPHPQAGRQRQPYLHTKRSSSRLSQVHAVPVVKVHGRIQAE